MASRSVFLLRFGEEVRRIRKAMELSQEELADIAGFDRTYISLIERGKRNLSLTNIVRFGRALRTTPDRLVKRIDPKDVGKD